MLVAAVAAVWADTPDRIGEIRGFVMTADGTPVSGVRVEAIPLPEHGLRIFFDEVTGPVRLDVDQVSLPVAPHTTTESGSDGAFRLSDLIAHRAYQVRALPRPPLAPSVVLHTAVADPSERVALRLVPGTRLAGRVTDGKGQGMRAVLSIVSDEGMSILDGDGVLGEWGAPLSHTDASGRFEFLAVPSGRQKLSARVPGWGAIETSLLAPKADELALSLATPVGGTVIGSVKDSSGKAIPGARIAFSCATEEVHRTRVGTTDERGAFRLEGVFPGTHSLVGAESPGFFLPEPMRARWDAVEVSADTVTSVDVVLRRTGTMVGRVLDEEASAVAHAEVHVVYPDGHAADGTPGRLRFTTTTGADGSFRVDGLPEGRGQVVASGPALEPVAATAIPPLSRHEVAGTPFQVGLEGERVTITLRVRRRPGAVVRVHGTVIDETGAPAAGAVVTYHLDDWSVVNGHQQRSTRSDAQGRFSFPEPLPSGDRQIEARTATRASAYTRHTFDAESVEKGVVVLVRPAAALSGRLVDHAGAPMPGVEVRACGRTFGGGFGGVDTGPEPVAPPTATDPEGRFSFSPMEPTVSDRVTVQIRDREANWLHPVIRDDEDRDLVWHEVPYGEHVTGVVVRAHETGVVGGTLVDADGAAVPGEAIHLSRQDSGMGWFRFVTVRTDAQGRFRVNGLMTGTYDAQLLDPYGVSLGPPVATGTSDVRLARPRRDENVRTLRLKVTTEGGEAVARADAHVVSGGTMVGPGVVRGGEGHVRFRSDGDPVALRVGEARDAEGRRLDVLVVTQEVASDAAEVSVVLPRATQATGRVLDDWGQPVSGVLVEVAREGLFSEGTLGDRWVLTAPDGTFLLTGDVSERMLVDIWPGDKWPRPRTLEVEPGGAPLEIRLVRGRSVWGVLVDEEGPIRRFEHTLFVEWPGGALPPRPVTADGTFSFVVPEDVDVVTVYAAPTMSGSIRSGVVATARGVQPGTRNLVLRLVSAAISGEIVGTGGEPILEGRVTATPAAEDWRPRTALESPFPVHAEDRLNGRWNGFALSDLSEGASRLVVLPQDERYEPIFVTEVSAPATDVRVAVPDAARLHGRLDGEVGGSAFRATWTAASPIDGVVTRSASVAPDGSFSLPISRSVAGTLLVRSDHDDRFAVAHDVKGDVRLQPTLSAGQRIEGRVAELAADEIDDATVVATLGSVRATSQLSADGRFSLRGLPPGRYEVTVEIVAPVNYESGKPQVVEAGQGDVVIRSGYRRRQAR